MTWFDLQNDASLVWVSLGKLVNASVLLGHFVNVLFSSKPSNLLYYLAPNLDEIVRVRLLENSEGDVWVPLSVLLLHSADSCVNEHEFSVGVHPDGCNLGRSILVDSGDVEEVLAL